MEGLYVAIMIIGLLLVLLAMILIWIDKKNFKRDIELVTEKETALREVVADAEYLIEELGKLYNSVSDHINSKKSELDKHAVNLATHLEQQLSQVEKKVYGLSEKIEIKQENINTSTNKNIKDIENKQKRLNINEKYKKVAELLNNGMNESEVAGALSISRGEVQMVSKMTKWGQA